MLKSLLRRAFAALSVALALTAAPASAATAAIARPALWEVSDADTTVYLFGTIHLLPENYQWRSAKFDQAIAGSRQLVVETIVDPDTPIVIYVPGDPSLLKPGAAVTIAAVKKPDGMITAARVTAEKDGVKPPM